MTFSQAIMRFERVVENKNVSAVLGFVGVVVMFVLFAGAWMQ